MKFHYAAGRSRRSSPQPSSAPRGSAAARLRRRRWRRSRGGVPARPARPRRDSAADAHDAAARRALALVPGGAPVSATNTLGAHLSERRRIFSFPVSRSGVGRRRRRRLTFLDSLEPGRARPHLDCTAPRPCAGSSSSPKTGSSYRKPGAPAIPRAAVALSASKLPRRAAVGTPEDEASAPRRCDLVSPTMRVRPSVRRSQCDSPCSASRAAEGAAPEPRLAPVFAQDVGSSSSGGARRDRLGRR